MNCGHGTDIITVLGHRLKTDQIGVIKSIGFVDFWQPCARNVQIDIAQFLRGVTIRNADNPRHEVVLRRAQRFDLKALRAVLRFQRSVVCDSRWIFSEGPKFHLAANSVRGTNTGDTNFVARRVERHGEAYRAEKRQLAAGAASAGFSALGAAALAPSAAGAAPAAFAASSSLAFRSLRGIAFSGLLRFGRFMMPAASRKRMMRSDGCAPFFIHAWTFSRSSLSRSVFSFGSSGLK